MNLTTTNITFLSDVNPSFKIDMSSGWNYHYFEGSIGAMSSFIRLIGPEKIYLVIPMFGNSPKNAKLYLSEPFLVNNKSNPALIIKFILEQWNSSAFELKKGITITYSIKFKRVWFSDK